MICDVCKNKNADISVEQSIGSNVKHIFLCRDCAKKWGLEMFPENLDISITKLLNKYDKNKKNEELNYLSCPYCGKKLSEIQKDKKIGCINCFLCFKSEITNILRKVKTNIKYTGKVQNAVPKEFSQKLSILELKQKLQKALNAEEYEQAALLRDELKALEKQYGI